MLSAALEIIPELGYGGMSVARVTGRAGVSRRTFYDVFADREDCFLTVFDEAAARAARVAQDAAVGQSGWRDQVRAGLSALLLFIGDEPVLSALMIVDALGSGTNVLARRARWLEILVGIVDQGRAEVLQGGPGPPPLTAEGVVGAVVSVLHARIVDRRARPRAMALLNPLMSMILLPYLGQQAASEELARPVPRTARRVKKPSRDPLDGLGLRLTYRTLRVLAAVAEHAGASNREVAAAAGITDQGQISKLLARLSQLGLIENSGRGHAKGDTNAWGLTPRGVEVESAIRVQTGG